jgi:hypothetical protein
MMRLPRQFAAGLPLTGLRRMPVVLIMTGLASVGIGQRSPTLGASVRQLRETGRRIAAAVLKHDIEILLANDRPDLRDGDRLSLQNTKDELYCAIFDRTCDPTGRASVSDILSGAKRLEIDVQLFRARGKRPYGLMLFFDATKVPRAKLRSASSLCQLAQRDQIVSWTFELTENGDWVLSLTIIH